MSQQNPTAPDPVKTLNRSAPRFHISPNLAFSPASQSNSHVTMRQIADLAGVCHSTVSRALANNPKISKKTRSKVAKVAYEMGYRTNPLVAAWMAHVRLKEKPVSMKGSLIFLHTRANETTFLTNFCRRCEAGARKRAYELGYRLKVMQATDFAGKLEGLQRMLDHGVFDGIVLPPSDSSQLDFNVNWDQTAGATIGFNLQKPAYDRVCVDGFANLTLAMEMLRAHGYRRIGLAISPSMLSKVGRIWIGSYLAFQSENSDYAQIPPLIVEANNHVGLSNWWETYQPEVVMLCQKFIVEMIQALGLSVPEDIGLANLSLNPDDSSAGINQNVEAVGAIAVEQVVAQILHNVKGEPARVKTTLVPGVWRDGDSIKAKREKRSLTLAS